MHAYIYLYFRYIFVIATADEVTRDYAYGESNPLARRCRLIPWIPTELEGISSQTSEPPDSYYEVRLIHTLNIATIHLFQWHSR